MAASRILPLNWATGAGGSIRTDETTPAGRALPPKAAIQSITMALRVGKDRPFAIGYVQAFNWSMTRDAQALHQIEPYPDGTFSAANTFDTAEFGNTFYWPGEPVESIPGKVGLVDITLKKCAMYSNNTMRSLLVADGAGTSHELEDIPASNADLHYTGAAQNEYISLIQQVRPVYIYQSYINPMSGTNAFGRTFEECWITSLGEEIPEASQNGPVMENTQLKATRIRPFAAAPATP